MILTQVISRTFFTERTVGAAMERDDCSQDFPPDMVMAFPASTTGPAESNYTRHVGLHVFLRDGRDAAVRKAFSYASPHSHAL